MRSTAQPLPTIRPSYRLLPPLGAKAYSPLDPRGPIEARIEWILAETEALLEEQPLSGPEWQRRVRQFERCREAMEYADVELGPPDLPPMELLARCWAVLHHNEVRFKALEAKGSHIGRHGLFMAQQWVQAVELLSNAESAAGVSVTRVDQLVRILEALNWLAGFLEHLLEKANKVSAANRLCQQLEDTRQRIRVLGGAVLQEEAVASSEEAFPHL